MQVIVHNVRLSYPYLFTMQAGRNDDGSPNPSKSCYSANFIFDKKANAADIAKVQKVVEEVKKDPKLKGRIVKKLPLREGSERKKIDPATDKEVFVQGYGPNTMFIGANNRARKNAPPTKPKVVDQSLVDMDPSCGKPYAGCYVNAKLDIYPYVHPASGAGITASIVTVQFVKDGEVLGDAGNTDQLGGLEAVPVEDNGVL